VSRDAQDVAPNRRGSRNGVRWHPRCSSRLDGKGGLKLNKLALNRETLQPMQTLGADEMADVNGGTVCSKVISALFC
jgi:hypothetical protein